MEKLTNSIDAILMRKCYEQGIDPKSSHAPRSIEEAIDRFFPKHGDWDLSEPRNKQAENIQILADSEPGDTSDTSLIIYDNGEGQRPEDFETTFLSLLRGNKNEIHFVQGKYNMGGSGSIAFCGKKRYQLIASKRFDGKGKFGFTLIRKHPLSSQEGQTKKNTWYEYLKIDGHIPSFDVSELDLGLFRRTFRTGTIIKLYSYELKGNKHIRRDLSRSLNEFLYEPALPIYTIEKRERYPNDKVLEGVVFGLKRRLDSSDYIETTFSETYRQKQIGQMKVTIHVFKPKAKGKTVKETRETIQGEFFKNNMVILFSVHGQVHGHYTSEFITRTLKFNLLRDYLLIHVDCTGMSLDFRNELFMASRDRLKQGEESQILRKVLGDNLREGELKEIYKRRKDSIAMEDTEDDALLQSFAENLPISDDLRHLLSRTFKLSQTDQAKQKQTPPKETKTKKEPIQFNPQRFPSYFKLDAKQQGKHKVLEVPLNGTKTVRFESDVENQYFDRVEEPGDMQIAIMNYIPNDSYGGDRQGTVNDISDLFSVVRKSPVDGTIKVVFKPTEDVQVGDEIQIQADLTSPGQIFTEIFWVKLTEPLPKQEDQAPIPEEDKVGLPKHVLVYKEASDGQDIMTWEKLESEAGVMMGYDIVMHPYLEGDILETIYINVDSRVLKEYKSKIRNLTVEQDQIANRRYFTSIYFHTIFLYVISRNLNYHISQGDEDQEIDLAEYLKTVFSSHYASFLLNFETSHLMEGLN